MSSIETNRITKNAIFSMFRTARKMGIKEDYRKAIYEQLKNFTLQDIVQFNEQYIKNKPKRYMIVADEKDLDFDAIEKQFGPVKKVKLEDIFGY